MQYFGVFSVVVLIFTPSIISFVLFVLTFYYRSKCITTARTPPASPNHLQRSQVEQLRVHHQNRGNNRMTNRTKSYFMVMMISSIVDMPVYLSIFISNYHNIVFYKQSSKLTEDLTYSELELLIINQFLPRLNFDYKSKIKTKLFILLYIFKHSVAFVEFYIFHIKFKKTFLKVSFFVFVLFLNKFYLDW